MNKRLILIIVTLSLVFIGMVGYHYYQHIFGNLINKTGAIYIRSTDNIDDVEKALLADPSKKAAPPENPMSADRVKWEHIHRVFELCNRNVSETARRLKMHRRTLQRILSKRSPR